MYTKVLTIAAVMAVAVAQHNSGYGHGHGHGHAVSSQNIVLHQSHGHQQHVPVVAHHAPIIAHHAPIIAHHTPVIAHAPVIAHHAPLVHHQPTHYVHSGHHEEHHAPAHYAFEYSVNDPHTGDIKSQHETREGDAVHGFYSLHEADGTVRRVDYTADAHHGFNAVVHREGHAAHAAPAHHQPAHHAY